VTTEAPPPALTTVEAVVRRQVSMALGGRRGMVEAGVPGLIFAAVFLTTKNVQAALVGSLSAATLLLVIRLVQRSSIQFVVNAFIAIGIGWLFVRLAASSGGSADEQALAYFLPGIIWSAVYFVLGAFTNLIGWPLMGFMVGATEEDPVAWHRNPQIVKLCKNLTWMMILPGALGVLLQGPFWVLGWSDVMSASTAVAVLAALRYGVSWPIRIAALSGMIWLLARNATPVDPEAFEAAREDEAPAQPAEPAQAD
jgi:hypothetical protein